MPELTAQQKQDKAERRMLRQTLVEAQVAFAEALRQVEQGRDVNEVFGAQPGESLATNVACDSSCV